MLFFQVLNYEEPRGLCTLEVQGLSINLNIDLVVYKSVAS